MKKDIAIVGAGLVGSLLSIYLSRRGYKVKIYERRPDMRTSLMSAGRSINLALSDRGIKALEEVGIMDDIRTIAIPMHGRYIHNADGTHAYQPYGKEGQFINSVSRGELNKKLMDLAEAHQVDIYFNTRCHGIDFENNRIRFDEQSSSEPFEVIFGSDGSYSAARLSFQLQTDRFQYQQFYIDYGYKELTIPSDATGGYRIEKNALHIWPRGNYMLIALPNTDGSFTCTLFFPFEGEASFAALDTKEKVRIFFDKTFADASAMMPDLEQEFMSNPTASLVTVKCHPWVKGGKFALIGDAAHAIVPFFGQGMNCGFEDCRVLNGLITKHEERWEDVFKEYQHLRKPDGDAIADLALNNFVEMRDKVADPVFLLQKKIEGRFSNLYPDKWIPAYSQVTFSPHIRYSEALSNGMKQEAIMKNVMRMDGIADKWDSPEVEKLMLEHIEKKHS